MRPNQAAALQLWRQVLAACRTAGNGDLDTDTMGYIALEIALGLMALDFTKQQLVTHFKNVVAEIEADEWRVVNAGLGLENTAGEDWSWIEQPLGTQGCPPGPCAPSAISASGTCLLQPTASAALHARPAMSFTTWTFDQPNQRWSVVSWHGPGAWSGDGRSGRVWRKESGNYQR